MKMKSSFRTSAEAERFFKTMEEAGKSEVAVGFFSRDTAEDGTSIAEIAAYNDLGTSHIPPRPFMEQAVEGHTEDIQAAVKEGYDCIVEGDNCETAYNIIGAFLQGLVQQEIVTGSFAPNSPATVRRKGSSQPLIDTGRMRQSVRYRVRKKGEGVE